eukprot:gene19646-2131_t
MCADRRGKFFQRCVYGFPSGGHVSACTAFCGSRPPCGAVWYDASLQHFSRTACFLLYDAGAVPDPCPETAGLMFVLRTTNEAYTALLPPTTTDS